MECLFEINITLLPVRILTHTIIAKGEDLRECEENARCHARTIAKDGYEEIIETQTGRYTYIYPAARVEHIVVINKGELNVEQHK